MVTLKITIWFLLVGGLFAMIIPGQNTSEVKTSATNIQDEETTVDQAPSLRVKRSKKTVQVVNDKMMASYGKMINKMQEKSVGIPNLKVGNMVRHMRPGHNPEEMGTYMEGDILTVREGSVDGVKGKPHFRWPKGVVHFRIDGDFNTDELYTISKAMESYHNFTCIRFKLWTEGVKDFISVGSGNTGCWSTLGRSGGMQRLNLQRNGCISSVGTPIHEFMHALGINHEQNRKDRDEYVKVKFENVKRGRANNFVKEPLFMGLGLNYDYGSVMHYSRFAFTKNKEQTIIPLEETSANIGQRKGFSLSDIEKINRLYNCRASNIPYQHLGPVPKPNFDEW